METPHDLYRQQRARHRRVCPRLQARRFVIRTLATIAAATVVLAAAPVAHAGRYPAQVPKHWHAPTWWLQQAACIRSHEGWWTAATGNGYEGAYQFVRSTWQAVGGAVDRAGHWASVASPREQNYRAWLNWRANGGRWGAGQWPTSSARCGLR